MIERPLPRTVDGISRRNRIDLATPVEQAVRAALEAVEGAGADIRLTKASMLLVETLAWLADYYEDVPVEEHYPRPAAPARCTVCGYDEESHKFVCACDRFQPSSEGRKSATP